MDIKTLKLIYETCGLLCNDCVLIFPFFYLSFFKAYKSVPVSFHRVNLDNKTGPLTHFPKAFTNTVKIES